jgi:hypothetical protein
VLEGELTPVLVLPLGLVLVLMPEFDVLDWPLTPA